MSIDDNIGLGLQSLVIEAVEVVFYIVLVPVGNEYSGAFEIDYLLRLAFHASVAIPSNPYQLYSVGNVFCVFPSITSMDYHIHRHCHLKCLFHSLGMVVGVAYYENFHFSPTSSVSRSSLSKTSAFALWLMAFFSSSESCAKVFPFSGT